MAIFGEKFYKNLGELSPWQQSIFALVLAHRQSPNFLLYAEMNEDTAAQNDFMHVLDTMWEYHMDKDNHIDLESLLEQLERHIPEIDDDTPYGAYPALDACISLSMSINAIINHFGDEAEQACGASICTVAKYLEITDDTLYSDEELYEKQLIVEEMDFQIELMNTISRAKRSLDFITKMKDECSGFEFSNIGISRY